jgi:hypothetical protein
LTSSAIEHSLVSLLGVAPGSTAFALAPGAPQAHAKRTIPDTSVSFDAIVLVNPRGLSLFATSFNPASSPLAFPSRFRIEKGEETPATKGQAQAW